MGKYQLGEFEEVVMLTVGVLYGNAYGVSIKKEIEERLKRKVSVLIKEIYGNLLNTL